MNILCVTSNYNMNILCVPRQLQDEYIMWNSQKSYLNTWQRTFIIYFFIFSFFLLLLFIFLTFWISNKVMPLPLTVTKITSQIDYV